MRWRKNEGGSSHGAVAGLCATPMLMCGRRGATRADVCSVQCAGRPAAVCAGNASSSVWCGCTEPHGSPSQRQPGSLARVPTSDHGSSFHAQALCRMNHVHARACVSVHHPRLHQGLDCTWTEWHGTRSWACWLSAAGRVAGLDISSSVRTTPTRLGLQAVSLSRSHPTRESSRGCVRQRRGRQAG